MAQIIKMTFLIAPVTVNAGLNLRAAGRWACHPPARKSQGLLDGIDSDGRFLAHETRRMRESHSEWEKLGQDEL